jgi:DNA-binding NarL/FixJ family response regulator
MPNLNGLEAARQILKQKPDQKILILTDIESEQVIHDCLEAGVRGWILKSDPIDELTAAIEQLQQNRSSFSPASRIWFWTATLSPTAQIQ